MSTQIPCPPLVPFLGHVTAIEKEVPLRSLNLLARQYGEIYELRIFSRKSVVVSSYDLVSEVSDDKRFFKAVSGGLAEVRNGVKDGLFTAYHDEENWGLAHRVLMPAFSTAAIRDTFDDMVDIASQLILKWERFGSTTSIDCADDFTRLTFDTIALCSMSYRLNSFYREDNHPFIKSLSSFLLESGRRSMRPSVVTSVMGYTAPYEADIEVMADLANKIVAERKVTPSDKNDLLNKMLSGRDPKTGKGLSDDCIKNNLLTFLIAGHETTSGTLSFLFYLLIKNPEASRKLRAEVDEVLGDQPIQLGDLSRMPYLIACLRESMRLFPTAPSRAVFPKEDTVIGNGKYAVSKDTTIRILSGQAMRDPKVWGEDAELFRPERMLDGKFEALPANAWQPFGYGMRGCIGRAFAWQEMIIVIATVIQRFDLVLEDPSYELEIKQTLTVKPKNFYVHAVPRKSLSARSFVPSSALQQARRGLEQPSRTPVVVDPNVKLQPLYVLYGSNTGTSESFAQRVAGDAAAYGEPADNAAHFVEWIKTLSGEEFSGVSFAVFGCGNRDWVKTYQRIPTLIDQTIEQRGGKRLLALGTGDASAAEFFKAFDEWEEHLWKILAKEYQTGAVTIGKDKVQALTMQVVDTGVNRAEILRQSDAVLGTVVENKVLTAPGASENRHIEFKLPEGMTARAGDYLAILPTNPVRDVNRVIARFGLSGDQQASRMVVLSAVGPTPLPVDKPITVFDLLSGYVELAQPATTRDLQILMTAENSPVETLQALSSSYSEQVLLKRLSVLDIIEDHPKIALPFETYLQMLPSMRIRQYSISSSPLWNPQNVTLTVSVIDAPSSTGRRMSFLGVGSTFLAGLLPGHKVQMSVRTSSTAFHPPSDPTAPMVMFAAGSGLAPMRGFLQERAVQKKAGREVATSILFFGCRSPQEDYIYADSDLKEWTELGIVDVRPAFSRSSGDSLGCKYVQDRVWLDRADITKAYAANAKFYTCGSRRVAQGIMGVLTKIVQEGQQVEEAKAAEILERLVEGRYATDVFE
ncbi:uncharacterized protein FIBRA_06695 [Fibroporia radiculosa]|uniref:Cytochrome P450 n=1 Tax=Fibroporia radiculosa TaxID=599839 RepID=J4H477_9APHY|nr:uncharacterized protein FIBRA_06695 [Fibroporia radiculosa]CCM04514.1 predicted protein [Fibroporia radiculosa]